ncbi:hypothetical protein TCAL_12527 [Tigriopus californicus]|uniref:Neurotransmitter-gated ion-channel ligand-binding domain-containing protein n=1 Tax=Tigriopus californicus TaxID=6832 RepID=A0A553P614_TIGCA|nr:hypothetical protein TCAL_12527 [Tigriopus californicus]
MSKYFCFVLLLVLLLRSRLIQSEPLNPDNATFAREGKGQINNLTSLGMALQKFVNRFEEVEMQQNRILDKAVRSLDRDSGGADGNRLPSVIHLLPDDYDKRQFPPQKDDDTPNEISITMDIYSIPQLDEKKEEIMLEVRLSHYWYDSRLEADFKKPIELVPEAIGEFWSPDSYFHHAKDSKTVNLIRKPASLRITPDKMIKYTMILQYNNYTWRRKPFLKRDTVLDNHNVKIAHYEFTYTSDGIKYPGLGIRIELRRYLGYHITQTYIPSVIYVAVAWLSFVVPSDVVPGRMVLCVTTLLTLTSMFNSVRNITPQASYMKAIDLWVFVCILFVFSSLAEYGLILHLTSRSAWQKRMDAHIRGKTGKASLKTISPAQLLSVTMHKEKRLGESLHPDFISPRGGSGQDGRQANCTISTPSPLAPRDPALPSDKERWAYTIEWTVKIIYPLAFAIFNAAYWTIYLRHYSSEPEV